MSKVSKGLGKGLDALFGNKNLVVDESKDNSLSNEAKNEIDVSKIKPNPFQPRKTFDEVKMKELTESIKKNGIIQPLILRKKNDKYEIVAGERRFRAAKRAGLKSVVAIVRQYNDEEMMELALIENIQRHDLNPVEEAEGIKNIMEQMSLTQAEVAKKLSRSRTAIANSIRLLNLSDFIKKNVSKGALNIGQVRPLLGLDSIDEQNKVAEYILEYGLSARMVEDILKKIREGASIEEVLEKEDLAEKKLDNKTNKKKKKEDLDSFYKDIQEKFIEALGTKVKLTKKNKNAGKIEIEYYCEEDLERIYEVLVKKDNVLKIEKLNETKFHV